MNRRELLTGAAALAAYHSLPAPAEALSLSETLTLLGGVGTSQDAAPAVWRSGGTQTMLPGLFNGGAGYVPQIQSEWSLSIWTRIPTTGTPYGYIWNFSRRGQTNNAVIGGSTVEAVALYWAGDNPSSATQKFRYALTGVDKAGNKFSATTAGSNNGFGYRSELMDNVGNRVLLTAQYRSGNIELWATYDGMRPRLIISQACTWTGTSGPLDVMFGGNLNLSNSSSLGVEVEAPILFPERSLSELQIAQLADGIDPETIGSGGVGVAAIRFATVTSGGSSASDTYAAKTPTDGQTVTLNGSVYTFKTSPSVGTDIQIVADVTATSVDATANTINKTSHGIPNGRRVALQAGSQPGGTNAFLPYTVINATADTFQLSTDGVNPVDITSVGFSPYTISGTVATLDNLVTALNALTPSSGGASNASYAVAGVDALTITHRVAGGTSFTFDTTATAKMPSNKRLALAQAYITDQTAFRDGIYGAPGLVRTRTNAWGTLPGTELAPNTPVGGAMRVTSWTSGMVAQHKNGTGYLALSGIYTGVAPSGLQVKITDLSDSSVVQDWTTCTSLTKDTSAKTWTAKITVPKGKRWLGLQTRKIGSTQATRPSEVRWGVGELVILMGQSLQGLMVGLNSAIVPNGFTSRFSGAGGQSPGTWPTDNCWHRFTTSAQIGAGEGVLANKLSNDGNCVVGMINRSIGGSSIAVLTDPAVWAALVADAGYSFTDSSLAPLAGWYLWDQGHADAGSGYGTKLDSLYSGLRSYFGSEIVFGLATVSNVRTSADATRSMWEVRQAQLQWIAGKSGDAYVVDLGDTDFYWSNTADGTHPVDATDMELKGELHALSMLKYRGIASYSGVGPTLTSVSRSGAVLTLTWALNGASGLTIANGNTNIGGVDVALNSVGFVALRSSVTCDASTDKVTWTAHPLSNNDPVIFSGTTLPGGTANGTTYYVINKTANDFQISATVGGSAIDLTSAGTGVVASSNKNLLVQSSHVVASATTTTLTLAADPGAPVMVNYLWGRPGRQAIDPVAALDTTSLSVMTQLNGAVQDNILCDNYTLSYSNSHITGRPARPTASPVVSN